MGFCHFLSYIQLKQINYSARDAVGGVPVTTPYYMTHPNFLTAAGIDTHRITIGKMMAPLP